MTISSLVMAAGEEIMIFSRPSLVFLSLGSEFITVEISHWYLVITV